MPIVNRDTWLDRTERFYSKLAAAVAWLAMASVALMSFSASFDVLKRWTTGWPIGGVMQLNECLMVVLVFCGLGYAQVHNRHIRIAFLISRMKPRTVLYFDLIGCVLSALCLALMCWKTADDALYSISILEYRSGDVRMPIYWAKSLIPLGLAILIGQLLLDAVKNWLCIIGKISKQESICNNPDED